jgi:hypothetical protein
VERGRWRLADLDLSASNRTLDSLGHRRAESCDSKDAHDPAGFHPSRPASVAFDRKAAVLIELRDEFDQLPELLCSASERSPFPLEVKAAPARRRHAGAVLALPPTLTLAVRLQHHRSRLRRATRRARRGWLAAARCPLTRAAFRLYLVTALVAPLSRKPLAPARREA